MVNEIITMARSCPSIYLLYPLGNAVRLKSDILVSSLFPLLFVCPVPYSSVKTADRVNYLREIVDYMYNQSLGIDGLLKISHRKNLNCDEWIVFRPDDK